MIEVSTIVVMIVGELLLLTSAVSVIMIITGIAKKARDHKAAKRVVETIKGDDARRQSETRTIFMNQFGLSSEEADAQAIRISRDERLFYQTMLQIYLKRDHEALLNLNVDFETAVAAYRGLQPKLDGQAVASESVATASAPLAAGSEEELQRLREENTRLSDELKLTMDTMGRMLTEYSAMFADGNTISVQKAEAPATTGTGAAPAPDEPDTGMGMIEDAAAAALLAAEKAEAGEDYDAFDLGSDNEDESDLSAGADLTGADAPIAEPEVEKGILEYDEDEISSDEEILLEDDVELKPEKAKTPEKPKKTQAPPSDMDDTVVSDFFANSASDEDFDDELDVDFGDALDFDEDDLK